MKTRKLSRFMANQCYLQSRSESTSAKSARHVWTVPKSSKIFTVQNHKRLLKASCIQYVSVLHLRKYKLQLHLEVTENSNFPCECKHRLQASSLSLPFGGLKSCGVVLVNDLCFDTWHVLLCHVFSRGYFCTHCSQIGATSNWFTTQGTKTKARIHETTVSDLSGRTLDVNNTNFSPTLQHTKNKSGRPHVRTPMVWE